MPLRASARSTAAGRTWLSGMAPRSDWRGADRVLCCFLLYKTRVMRCSGRGQPTSNYHNGHGWRYTNHQERGGQQTSHCNHRSEKCSTMEEKTKTIKAMPKRRPYKRVLVPGRYGQRVSRCLGRNGRPNRGKNNQNGGGGVTKQGWKQGTTGAKTEAARSGSMQRGTGHAEEGGADGLWGGGREGGCDASSGAGDTA